MTGDHRAGRRRGYALAFEAAVCLAAARLALLALPFRQIAAWTTRGVAARPRAGAARTRAIAEVQWAVAAAAARLPGQTLCFPRALAAQSMLRRRGVATTLVYGVRTRDAMLDAHAWLTAGADGVVGHEVAMRYAALASYSNERLDADRGHVRQTDS